jgi:hypothetical protein
VVGFSPRFTTGEKKKKPPSLIHASTCKYNGFLYQENSEDLCSACVHTGASSMVLLYVELEARALLSSSFLPICSCS